MPPIQSLQHIEAQDPRFLGLRRRIRNTWVLWVVLSLLGWIVLEELAAILSLLIFGGMLLWLLLELYHRLQIENFHHYRQIESLFGLYNMIDIVAALPPMRLWVISPDFANLIVATIRKYRPGVVVELGGGVSTIICGYGIQAQSEGHIISLEHIEVFAHQTEQNLAAHGVGKLATVIHTPLISVTLNNEIYHWYDMTQVQFDSPIDLLIIDGPPEGTNHNARYPALPMLFDKLAAGAIILVDDFLRPDETQIVNRWLAEFDLDMIETLANEKGAAVLRKRSLA